MAQMSPPQFLRNSSWKLFLGTFGEVPGPLPKTFLGTDIFDLVPSCGKDGFPRNSWEHHFLMWISILVCAASPQGTQSPSFWESGMPYHKHCNWAESSSIKVGDQPEQTDPFRVFGISSFVSVTLFRMADEGGGCQLQSQSSDLQDSYKIIHQSLKCNKLIAMCAWATTSCLSQHCHRNP